MVLRKPQIRVWLGYKLCLVMLLDICSFLQKYVYVHVKRPLLTSSATHQTVLSLISCFAGGVFLSACLLDIIPDYLSDINVELDNRKLEVCPCGDRFG